MAASFNDQANPGLFVPTTNVWDVARLEEVNVNSPEFKELLIRLYQNINTISIALNWKETGFFVQQEFVIGSVYFANPLLTDTTPQTPTLRQVFRIVVNFGALPVAALKSVPHGLTITPGFTFTRIFATATNPSNSFIPIPYASTTGDTIEINVDAVNVNIITTSNRSAFTTTYCILEYIKQ